MLLQGVLLVISEHQFVLFANIWSTDNVTLVCGFVLISWHNVDQIMYNIVYVPMVYTYKLTNLWHIVNNKNEYNAT
jgi:hypothetical protein